MRRKVRGDGHHRTLLARGARAAMYEAIWDRFCEETSRTFEDSKQWREFEHLFASLLRKIADEVERKHLGRG